MMMYTKLITPIIIGLLISVSGLAQKRPNILFIMSDQHNANALGCYGSDIVQTPNIDRIAKQGVLFEKAYCQTAQCVPSRYSIWTGMYARSTGTYFNGHGQNPDINTVADIFKKQGYVTGNIGKHHQVMNEENNNHGFDLVSVPNGKLKTINALPYDEAHPGRSAVGTYSGSNEEHTSGLTTIETIDFIEKNSENSFVLWYSFYGPHTPIAPSEPWASQYNYKEIDLPPNHTSIDYKTPGMDRLLSKSGTYSDVDLHKKTLALYYGMISQIDYNIGLVLDKLDELDIADNTIIVYTSDHGEMMSEHGSWTKGLTGYEATIRVPMIISYPPKMASGKRVSKLACSIDLLPTLLDLAGQEIPDDIQGKSLSGLNNKITDWRKYAFSEIGKNIDNSTVVARSENQKYVQFRKKGEIVYEQFFNNETDPWEMTNLMDDKEYNNTIEEFKIALKKWEEETSVVSIVEKVKKIKSK
jgi:iduronate 2-sulfatase